MKNVFKVVTGILLAATLAVGCREMTPEEKAAQQKEQAEQAQRDSIAAVNQRQRAAEEKAARIVAEKKRVEDIRAGRAQGTLAQYEIGDFKIEERSTPGIPGNITIIVNGEEAAVGISNFDTQQKDTQYPRLLHSQKTGRGDAMIAFRAASDTNVVCTFVQRFANSSVHNRELNAHSVHVYTGALTTARMK